MSFFEVTSKYVPLGRVFTGSYPIQSQTVPEFNIVPTKIGSYSSEFWSTVLGHESIYINNRRKQNKSVVLVLFFYYACVPSRKNKTMPFLFKHSCIWLICFCRVTVGDYTSVNQTNMGDGQKDPVEPTNGNLYETRGRY